MISAAAAHCLAERKGRGEKQEALARAVGMSPSGFSELVSGAKTGRLPQLEKLAAAFGYDLSGFLALGKRLLEGKGEDAKSARPRPPLQAPGTCQVCLPAWDQAELKKHEREYLEMALEILRSKQVSKGKYALALRQNITAFHEPVSEKIAALEGADTPPGAEVRRGPAGKAQGKRRAAGGA